MPTISRFFGIKIKMYLRDHPPPHFHVRSGGQAAAIAIDTLEIIGGRLPGRVLARAQEWAMVHRPELRENWQRAQRGEAVYPIAARQEDS